MPTVITDVDRSPWYDRIEAPRECYAGTRCAALPTKKANVPPLEANVQTPKANAPLLNANAAMYDTNEVNVGSHAD